MFTVSVHLEISTTISIGKAVDFPQLCILFFYLNHNNVFNSKVHNFTNCLNYKLQWSIFTNNLFFGNKIYLEVDLGKGLPDVILLELFGFELAREFRLQESNFQLQSFPWKWWCGLSFVKWNQGKCQEVDFICLKIYVEVYFWKGSTDAILRELFGFELEREFRFQDVIFRCRVCRGYGDMASVY